MVGPRTHHAFTLVEILIVVLILGILAAIVIPSFAPATSDTRKAALSHQLDAVRAQIQLYTLQHGDTYPTLSGADWDPLITQTTYSGKPCGPYLPSVPRNTLNNYTGIAVVNADPDWGEPVQGSGIGFVYNTSNGYIWGTNSAGSKVYNEGNPDDPNN